MCLVLTVPSLAARKPHNVVLGSSRTVPYYFSVTNSAEVPTKKTVIRVRPLLIDGQIKEWTGESHHNVTDRSFVVRRAMRINDALPTEKTDRWIWQLGPWLLVDRISGHISVLHLPSYDPAISEVVWFRDYGAYCGLATSGKKLEAVVSQIGGRRPILSKEVKPWAPEVSTQQACGKTTWQKNPLRVTFHPTGTEPVSFDLLGNTAVLLEEEDQESLK